MKNKKLYRTTEFNAISHINRKNSRQTLQKVSLLIISITLTLMIARKINNYYHYKNIQWEKKIRDQSISKKNKNKIEHIRHQSAWQKYLCSIEKMHHFITMINYLSAHPNHQMVINQIALNNQQITIDSTISKPQLISTWIESLPLHCAITHIHQNSNLRLQCQIKMGSRSCS